MRRMCRDAPARWRGILTLLLDALKGRRRGGDCERLILGMPIWWDGGNSLDPFGRPVGTLSLQAEHQKRIGGWQRQS